MFARNVVALSLLAASTTVLADTVDINLRDNSAQLQYFAPLGRDTIGTSELHAGFLYNNKSDRFADFGIAVKGPVGGSDSGVAAGVGLKGLVARVNSNDVLALALGGQARFALPTIVPLSIAGQVYFSPSIVTYRDADRFVEGSVRLEYQVIPQAAAYIGYRRLSFGLKSKPDTVLDSGFYIGARMSF